MSNQNDWGDRCDPYVTSFVDRHGKTRHRFRFGKDVSVYMPPPDSPEYPALYASLLGAMPETKEGLCYFVGAQQVGLVKIGYAKDVEMRVNHLQVNTPVEVRLLATAEGGLWREREYHIRFAADRVRGEWFKLTPEIEKEIERLAA